MLSIIVARAKNHIIGKENQLPWHLPADLAWFRENTLGKPVVMGRKTYESIGRLLPKRPNIIVSRQGFCVEGAHCATNLTQALEIARSFGEEVMIIGGGEIFREMLPLADRLYLTEVQAEVEGDTHFEFDESQWQIAHEHYLEADENNPFACRFLCLTRA